MSFTISRLLPHMAPSTSHERHRMTSAQNVTTLATDIPPASCQEGRHPGSMRERSENVHTTQTCTTQLKHVQHNTHLPCCQFGNRNYHLSPLRLGPLLVYRARPLLSLAGSWGRGYTERLRPAPNFQRAREVV